MHALRMMLGGLPSYTVSINANRSYWRAVAELPTWAWRQPVRLTIRISAGVTVTGVAAFGAIDLQDLPAGSEVMIINRGNLYMADTVDPAASAMAAVNGSGPVPFGGLLAIDNGGGVIRGAYSSTDSAYGAAIRHDGRALTFISAGTITGAVDWP